MPLFRGAIANVLLVAACAIAAMSAFGTTACKGKQDIHDSDEVKGRDCIGCHRAAFMAASNPRHVGSMPETCNTCHTTKAWSPATGATHDWFPLRNKHAQQACATCHTNGYQPGATSKDCASCHQKDYDAAKNPPHAGYSKDCTTCHNDAGWKPSIFEHAWPLVGKHASAACASCHVGNPAVYQGTPRECVGCHKKDYDGAVNPSHAGFSTACQTCHQETAWKPSVFNHPWPLDGAHATAPCAGCHTGSPPKYAGTSKNCVSCHLADYNASPYPGHNAFPQTCQDCHSKTAWKPAISGAHPEALFPLTTGKHANPGISCTDCHDPNLGSSAQGQNTNCINCHLGAHRRPSIDSAHNGVANYPAGAAPVNFCRTCHPAGRK
jgi:hypothetical protein